MEIIDENVSTFDLVDDSNVEIITLENEDDSSFKYIDEDMLNSAVQINIDDYLSQGKNKEPLIEVYAKVNQDGFITDVSSSVFLKDTTGWTKIDEGSGDRFAHAKSQYFEDGIMNENAESVSYTI